MTDIETRPNAWHSISEGPDAELAELRRRLAAAELRIMKLVQAEDFQQFSFEDMKRRAERAEAAEQQLLIEKITPLLPDEFENAAEGIADTMVGDIAAGTLLDELDINGHIESYLEGRTEYEADGFTPAGLEAPF
jgi:hypothetical protein